MVTGLLGGLDSQTRKSALPPSGTARDLRSMEDWGLVVVLALTSSGMSSSMI